jgi:imidazolonepropionase
MTVTLLLNAAEVITAVPAPGNPAGRLTDAALAFEGERLLVVGPTEAVSAQFASVETRRLDVSGRVVAPGFVDSHTHVVFGGSRVREYAARLTRTADEVKALGIPTGILATVQMTRAAGVDELVAAATDRLRRMLAHGITTVESKSGYGLTAFDELKMLEVNRRLRAVQPVDIVSTFLGAHAFPPELPRERYVDLVVNEMLPRVAEAKLAEFCDVFCDEGYFTLAQTRRVLEAGRAAGLKLKAHVDQYSALGGSELAAEMKLVSADHLNHTPRPTMQRLAEAGVVGVLMPSIDFAVKHPRPFDARALLAAGLSIALATDVCPGGWVESMPLVLQLACRQHGLSPEEALLAATVGGARALDLHDRGTLAPGQLADIQIWDVPSLEDVAYRIGHNPVQRVIKRGKSVVNREQ